MLKSDLIRPRLRIRDSQVYSQPIPANYHYLTLGSALINLFQQQIGQNRGALTEAIRDYEGDSLDYPVIRGLAAVLEGFCRFGNSPPVDPTELRATLFQQGPVSHKPDLFNPVTRDEILAETAAIYKLTTTQVEEALFADLMEEQLLLELEDLPTPGDLIMRYNVELARGVLYWAKEVRLFIGDHYKDVFKFIKLFKLMHTIQPLSEENVRYRITLHGPISPFVKSTIRYGLQFAKFLPALLLCESWHMSADIQLPYRDKPVQYTLNDQTDLRSHFKSSGLFDSQLEADFAAEFEAKYQGGKRTWTLHREDEIIPLGDSVFIPDFSLTHQRDGRRALIEIVGFWHPTYLRRKLAKVREAGLQNLILLVYESANIAEGPFEEAAEGAVLRFTRKPVLKEVLAAVERVAV